MAQLTAEVMSVGDEIISGQRLDTNTQWICQSLGELGIDVRFHSSVGDDLHDHVAAIKIAIARVEFVVITGGLGPTADDLTRTAIAYAAGVELEFHQSVLAAISHMYQRFGRQMPASNEAQAWFPAGSVIINNPEGTAPGIDLTIQRTDMRPVRIFALPGVPVEMKQMWIETVQPELRRQADHDLTYCYHTINCFGAGESTIESMLPNLVQRGRDPKVGITASAATITLRVSTLAKSKAECLQKMQPTIDEIRSCLGELVFGENDRTLAEVVIELLDKMKWNVAISAGGLNGEFGELFGHGSILVHQPDAQLGIADPTTLAQTIRAKLNTQIGLAIGPIDLDEHQIASGRSEFEVAIVGPAANIGESFRYGGHSEWRHARAAKQVLNLLRLYLLRLK